MTETDKHPRPTGRCRSIASLASRRHAYWCEVGSILGMLTFVAALSVALCVAAVKFLGASPQVAAFLCAAIMGPPVWMLWPDYPTTEDIERDRALRRNAGLPDDVERE